MYAVEDGIEVKNIQDERKAVEVKYKNMNKVNKSQKKKKHRRRRTTLIE